MMMTKPRIAISGMGAITPYGEGVNTLWQALLEGASAISSCDRFDLGGVACTHAGLIRATPSIPGLENASRAVSFAAAACREALDEAGLLNNLDACHSMALITASNFGDMESAEQTLSATEYKPCDATACAQSSVTDLLADAFHLKGIRLALSLSCASGASAVATAASLLNANRATRVLVVGYDVISPYSWSGLCSLRTMTKEKVRPFDVNRSGTIFSEGAAALLLERLEDAETPARAPFAYLTGWASGNNGFHLTAPALRGAGSAQVMREALTQAGLQPAAIDHINAHGTGTHPNDSTETQAIQDVFQDAAPSIPVTSVKGALGHLLGAAGTVEILVSVLSLKHNLIPPTANYETPDPACDLDIVTSPRTATLTHVLSNSAGFGGCNAAVILSKTAPARTSSTPIPAGAAQQVFITGLGAVCALGADKEEITLALREGEPALAPLSRFAVHNPPSVGEAPPVDLASCGVSKKAYLDPASTLFLAATGQAIQQAGLSAEQRAALNVGILAGTTYGCLETTELFFADYLAKGPRLVKPMLFPHTYTNAPASLAAMEWSLTGEHENNVSADIASGVALVQAYDLLRAGRSHTLAVSGVEALSPMRLRANPGASPLGEGAATLILSTDAPAPLARILGCALAPTLSDAVSGALAHAALTREAIEAVYVNLNAADATRALFPSEKIMAPDKLCGNVEGASSALHLCFALLFGHQGPLLILTSNRSTTVALLVQRC
jgi:3-oxoacyl-[acyl-carrier-protein] synthase II